MKIMHDFQIFECQEFGGVSRYHIELIKEINKINESRVEIPIKYSANEYLKLYNGTPKKCKHHRNRLIRKIFNIRNRIVNEFCSISKAKKMDIVHITWVNPYLNKIAKGKFVVTIHDMVHEIFWKDNPQCKSEIENKKRAIYESSAIIAISENTKRDILRLYPDVPENKIFVIYHGTNHLPKPHVPRESLPDRYILYVGKRGDYKGAKFLIESVHEVLKEYKDIKLLFVGGGQFSSSEIELLKSYGITDLTVQMNVSDAELSYIYQNAICFIYPSLYEGFGFPILEAFDNNCPVVCTNSSSLPEVGGNAAMYFEQNDKKGLCDCITSLINDESIRRSYIGLGRDRVKQFSWKKCAKETYEVYKIIRAKHN